MSNSLFTKKSIDSIIAQSEEKEHKLKRALSAFDLTFLGIGAIIGAGIFVLTGVAASIHSGPAVVLSFVVSGLACAFAALCYAEFASMIPVAGSAYTYAYATLGQLLAWIIGWDLILEYAVGSIAVSIGWSGYFVDLLHGIGIHIPTWACSPLPNGVNIPAAIIVTIITIILVIGIKESAKVNNIMVWIVLAVIILFVFLGIFWVRPDNWSPFIPFGWHGIMTGAAIVFFAYIGFDAVSTTAEEARKPQRDLPIGIIASLIICTILYVAVAGVLTGILPVTEYSQNQNYLSAPIAFALRIIKQDWASGIISIGAIAALTTTLLVMLMGQPRVFFAMSRDGLLPQKISRVHPRFQTPYITTIITGVTVGAIALLVPIGTAAELCNIGTLFAFAIVSASVIILRIVEPNRHRPFKTPLFYIIAPLGVLSALYLIYNLPVLTWFRFLVWLDIGFLIYYFYSRTHSRLGKPLKPFSLKSILEFFGFVIFMNGFLFAILAVLTVFDITSIKTWQEVNLDPGKSLLYCGVLIGAGLVMWIVGKLTKTKGEL